MFEEVAESSTPCLERSLLRFGRKPKKRAGGFGSESHDEPVKDKAGAPGNFRVGVIGQFLEKGDGRLSGFPKGDRNRLPLLKAIRTQPTPCLLPVGES